MAETLVFDDKIQSTDGRLTLEVTPSTELGVERVPAPKPALEITPSEAWAKSSPELVVSGAGAAVAKTTPEVKLVLDGAATSAPASAAAAPAAPAAPTAPAAPAAAAAAVAAAAAPTAPSPAPTPTPAAYAPASYSAAAVAASPAAASAATFPQTTYAPAQPTPAYVGGVPYAQYNAQIQAQVQAQPQPAASQAVYTGSQNAQMTYNPQFTGVSSYAAAPMQLYMYPEATYPMTQKDRNLRMFAFILNLISTISVGWAIIPLAWMIPMTVISWNIYKGTRQPTMAFSICDLIFTNLISGILLLVGDTKPE